MVVDLLLVLQVQRVHRRVDDALLERVLVRLQVCARQALRTHRRRRIALPCGRPSRRLPKQALAGAYVVLGDALRLLLQRRQAADQLSAVGRIGAAIVSTQRALDLPGQIPVLALRPRIERVRLAGFRGLAGVAHVCKSSMSTQ